MTVKITNDDVDVIWKQIRDFEHAVPGIRYGEDYPEFALAVVGSKSFDSMVMSASMLGILATISLPKEKLLEAEQSSNPDEGKKQFMETLLKKSPLRETLLQALYLGYRLGKQGL